MTRQLANDLQLKNNTVAKAYRLLERGSIIETLGRRGTFIHPEAKKNSLVDLNELALSLLSSSVTELRHSGATDSEIRNAFTAVMKDRQIQENPVNSWGFSEIYLDPPERLLVGGREMSASTFKEHANLLNPGRQAMTPSSPSIAFAVSRPDHRSRLLQWCHTKRIPSAGFVPHTPPHFQFCSSCRGGKAH